MREQFIDDQRLDHERILATDRARKSGLLDQRTEQIEVGIRRDHNVEPSVRFQPLTRLVEQRRNVAILRTGVPAAIREVTRLARMLGGLDRITSNSGRGASAASRSEQRRGDAVTEPLACAFSAAESAAFGLMSVAITFGAGAGRRQREDA